MLVILELTSSRPELLFIFSEENAFNLFIDKGLESIMTFNFLIYVSNVLDDFGISLVSFRPIFVNKSLKTSAILGLL